MGMGTALQPAMAAAASNTAHRPRPLPAANRGTSRPTASAPPVRALVCSAPPQSRPPRHAVSTTARAAEAGAASSTSPDAVTYSSSINTDMPLYEPPGVSFDEYLQDRPRVFRAMFPDESRSQQLSDEEWRIQMLPLEFLFITVRPVVVMQLRNRAAGGLDLRITEWELRGLDSGYTPASFDLGVRGSLYADRGQRRGSRLRGHLEISITVALPPPMRIVPEAVLRGVAESVLSTLAERMKRDVDVGLVADFRRFRLEKAASRAAVTRADSKA
ncbi:uncharacterized protein LOC119353691 [Triticum dicoccoides]|uniref:uncharacterized protein LOC119353691 n=1 Tax=Triticum dicoccoides TaxID=85692 RepID=UPI00162DE46B|nr:uncharacterized protein LOC119353691 [Triticum dicoccoides]